MPAHTITARQQHILASAVPRFYAGDVSHAGSTTCSRRYPKAPAEPSTLSLTEAELRRHGNDLHAAGWSIEEILTVLAIEPAS